MFIFKLSPTYIIATGVYCTTSGMKLTSTDYRSLYIYYSPQFHCFIAASNKLLLLLCFMTKSSNMVCFYMLLLLFYNVCPYVYRNVLNMDRCIYILYSTHILCRVWYSEPFLKFLFATYGFCLEY